MSLNGSHNGGAVAQNSQDQSYFAIKCHLCGVMRRQLTRHLRVAHSIDSANYLAMFPGATSDVPASRKRSEECRAKQSKAAKERWASAEERSAQSQRLRESAPWKGKNCPRNIAGRLALGAWGGMFLRTTRKKEHA